MEKLSKFSINTDVKKSPLLLKCFRRLREGTEASLLNKKRKPNFRAANTSYQRLWGDSPLCPKACPGIREVLQAQAGEESS